MAGSASIQHFNWKNKQVARTCMSTLVAAMAEDPVSAYFSGNNCIRFVKEEVKGYLKCLPEATNFISTADHKAVALWQLLPEETPDNALLAGWTRCLHVPLRLWPSMVRMELQYDKAHEAVTSDIGSYYYCGFIGTHPEVRGKGYGSMLLKHITDKADSEGRWCLLEATSERSQALYARHGFETYQTYHVTKHAPPMYMMKRAPLTAAAPKQAHKSIAVLAANKTAAAPESSGEDSLELIPAVHAGQAVSAV